MKKSGRPHLQLVWDKDAKFRNSRAYREPVQLSLRIGHYENLIAFIGEAALSGILFTDVLRILQPHYLLDLRTCPRFDFSGYSRKRAFSDFERWEAKYICLSADETSGGISDRVHTLITKLLRDSKKLTGPLVVLVETAEAIDQVSQVIPDPNTSIGKWSITVDGLSSSDASSG